jgi:hypothetical protein
LESREPLQEQFLRGGDGGLFEDGVCHGRRAGNRGRRPYISAYTATGYVRAPYDQGAARVQYAYNTPPFLSLSLRLQSIDSEILSFPIGNRSMCSLRKRIESAFWKSDPYSHGIDGNSLYSWRWVYSSHASNCLKILGFWVLGFGVLGFRV